MPQPSDDGSFGSSLDGDALRPGHRPAADRRGVIGDGTGQSLGNICVVGMKAQELDHCPQEILDVFGLRLFTAAGVGFFAVGMTFCGSLNFQFSTNPLDSRCRCPNAP
jgi:hypothetical protein